MLRIDRTLYSQLETYAAPHDFDAIDRAATALVDAAGVGAVFPTKGAACNRTAVDLSHLAPGYEKPASYQRHAYQTVRDFDWLHLYFEEVIWPEALGVARTVDALCHDTARPRVHKIDGNQAQTAVKRDVLALMKNVM